MKYHDPIYGPVVIEEPVLLALLSAAPMQRLQHIVQQGITGIIGMTEPVTRFEHSVGAMLLVRRLGGDLEEQIGALLHDVSHTAFSHVIDFVVGSHSRQSYHDEQKEAYMRRTDLPQILADFGYDWHQFVDEAAFPLLEQPAPRLCVDRLDYFLRDAVALELATTAVLPDILSQLVVVNGRIATNDIDTARWLAYRYISADDRRWSNFQEVGIYEITAHAIRRALALGVIVEADFWDTDEVLWQKLHSSSDARLQAQLALIQPQTTFAWDEVQPTFCVQTKIRTIDPDLVVAGERRPLSAVDPEFAAFRQHYLQRKQGRWPMRLLTGAELFASEG